MHLDTMPPLELTPSNMFNRTPLPETTELSPSSGWLQWDLAVRLQDSERDFRR